MNQSIFDYAHSQRKELRRQAAIFASLSNPDFKSLPFGEQIRVRLAESLIGLGTRLKAQTPVSRRGLIDSSQSSWRSQ